MRLALTTVKGISEGEVARLVAGQPYTGLQDLWQRARPSLPVAQRLIRVGALGPLPGDLTRRDLLLQAAELHRQSRSRAATDGQLPLGGELVTATPSSAGGVGEEHAHLGVFDASCGTGVLPLYPCRGVALLHKAGLVDHKNGVVGAEMVGDVGPQVVADRICIPAGVAQQALHRPGSGMARAFGQLPAVLPLDARQKPEQVGAGHGPRLNSPEPARDPGHDLVEHRPPADRVHAVARGHRTIFRSPHNPR